MEEVCVVGGDGQVAQDGARGFQPCPTAKQDSGDFGETTFPAFTHPALRLFLAQEEERCGRKNLHGVSRDVIAK